MREFDSGLSRDVLEAASGRSIDTIEEMRGEGAAISYLGSEVFVDEGGLAWGTICDYDADSEATLREHSERAELPVSSVWMRGSPLAGVAPRSGVAPKPAQ
jgi:hypothetical protein